MIWFHNKNRILIKHRVPLLAFKIRVHKSHKIKFDSLKVLRKLISKNQIHNHRMTSLSLILKIKKCWVKWKRKWQILRMK